AALEAAGAKISAGSLVAPNLTSIATKPGSHKVKVAGRADGIAANPVTLTVVITPAPGQKAKPKHAAH
ncbi:MAG TPA: hypothetical protein VN671_09450, partial [Solirubrobacterales bacterium]|nr:hypothetical protein [Solirubrobacterales bacterium]